MAGRESAAAAEVVRLIQGGKSYREAAKLAGCSLSTAWRAHERERERQQTQGDPAKPQRASA